MNMRSQNISSVKVVKILLMSFLLMIFCEFPTVSVSPALADSAAVIDAEVDTALKRLYSSNAAAKNISEAAKGVLVFPDIIKGGFIVGGQYGKGALRINGKTTRYYQTASASFGLQAGAQSFGYAMFFMTNSGLDYLRSSDGWEVGVGPSVVVVDQGVAKSLTTTTYKDDILVFFFNQKGLMAGIVITGTKISPYSPDPN